MTNSDAAARAERHALELSLAEAASAMLARFLACAENVAVAALNSPVMVAAVLPQPFSLDRLRSLWAGLRAAHSSSPLSDDVAESVFAKAAAVLRMPHGSKAGARRALARALAFEGAEGWQAVAERSARTAATRQFSQRQMARFEDAGIAGKRWHADLDSATRPTHRAADGQSVPLASVFTVGGFPMLYPGDPAAPPEETENCRCVIVAASVPSLVASLGTEGAGMLDAIRDRSPGFPLGLAVLLAATWDELAHPRGKDGRFLPKTKFHRTLEKVRDMYAEKITSGEITHPDQLSGLTQDVIDSAYKKAGVPKPGGSQTGEQVGRRIHPPVREPGAGGEYADLADRMAAGKDIAGTSLGKDIEAAIEDWTTASPRQTNRDEFEKLVDAAPDSTIPLYRGLTARDNGRAGAMKLVRQLKESKPGDSVETSILASWSESELIARRFTSESSLSDAARARDGKNAAEGVLIVAEPGIKALPIGGYVSYDTQDAYGDMKESVAPPSVYTVVSNEPHPDVQNLRVITVRRG